MPCGWFLKKLAKSGALSIFSCLFEGFKLALDGFTRRSSFVNDDSISEVVRDSFVQGPAGYASDARVDQALFIDAPGRGMVCVLRMIEDSDAVGFFSKGTFDIAPLPALLFASTSTPAFR